MNIKQKLITLLLFIGLIPTLAVGVVSYVTISRELNSNVDNQIESTSVKQQQKISALLQARQEEVSQLSNEYDLQVALAQYSKDGDAAALASVAQAIQTKKNDVPDIQAISITDLKGKIMASTLDGTTGKNDTSALAFAKSQQDTNVLIRQDPNDGLDKLYSYTLLSVNNQNTATMAVVFRIDDITAAVQDYTGLGATGETIIGQKDAQGHIISQFPLRFNTGAALQTNLDSLKLTSHTDGAVYSKVKDYRGNTVIISANTVGFANWIVAAKIDTAEALAPIMQLQNALIAIAVISSVVIVLVAVYFSRLFTAPILSIAGTSKRIGQGDFSAHIDLHRSDEFGALAHSINGMGTSLREFVTHIESQRTRLEIILNSTEEAIVAIDENDVITTANRATVELVGLPIDKIIGQRVSNVFRWTRDSQSYAIEYDGADNNYSDLQYLSHDGTTHYVTLNVARVTDTKSSATQTIMTIHDETKSRELENMKIDFVSMAAHELRTPLAAIRGYLELISFKEKATISTETQKYLNQAAKSTVELGGLINNLLDVTRIERGTLALNMDKIDLAGNVAQSVRDARFTAADKNITLSYDDTAHDCPVKADPIALHEVINNLITNAIKYTEAGGRIVVIVSRQGDHFEVAVKDNGIGIPKAALPNLFTKFYRVHGGLNSGSTGTGLGLFISKSIIERHGGTISVDSQEGVGSTFKFTIPMLTEQVAPTSTAEPLDASNTRRTRGWTTKNITR